MTCHIRVGDTSPLSNDISIFRHTHLHIGDDDISRRRVVNSFILGLDPFQAKGLTPWSNSRLYSRHHFTVVYFHTVVPFIFYPFCLINFSPCSISIKKFDIF